MSILFIYKTPNKCLFNNINSHYMLEIQGWFERKLCIPSAKGLLCFQISVPHVGIKTSRLKVTQENMVARGNCYWLIYVVILRFPPCFPPKYYFSYLMLTTVWEYYIVDFRIDFWTSRNRNSDTLFFLAIALWRLRNIFIGYSHCRWLSMSFSSL